MKGRIVIAATVIAAIPLVTPKASALPPGLSDPNAFTAVDAASHIVHYPRSGAAVIIATPDGVRTITNMSPASRLRVCHYQQIPARR
jgi:hypothetical protein